MTEHDILTIIFTTIACIAIPLVCGYLDINSTWMNYKRGTGAEANGLIASFITQHWWMWARVGSLVVVEIALLFNCWRTHTSPAIFAGFGIFLAAAYYLFIVKRNYNLAGSDD